MGPVDEDLTLVEADVESTDHCVLTKSKLELFGLVDLVSNVVLSLFDKKNFIDLVKLNIDDFFLGENSWLE